MKFVSSYEYNQRHLNKCAAAAAATFNWEQREHMFVFAIGFHRDLLMKNCNKNVLIGGFFFRFDSDNSHKNE